MAGMAVFAVFYSRWSRPRIDRFRSAKAKRIELEVLANTQHPLGRFHKLFR
jgi:hypothetical protein